MDEPSFYFVSFLVGLIFGFSELLSRYRVVKTIFSRSPSIIYLLLNGFIAVITYYILIEQNIELGGIAAEPLGKSVVAGLSAMVILRSSFMNIKVGDKTFDAGLGAITQIFLLSADRNFDQSVSKDRLEKVIPIMKDIEFKDASKALPLVCLTIMQNVPFEEQKALGEDVEKLTSRTDVSDETKCLCLGILLEKLVGIELLKHAAKSFSVNHNGQTDEKNRLEELIKAYTK